jgi:hypothetical protein
MGESKKHVMSWTVTAVVLCVALAAVGFALYPPPVTPLAGGEKPPENTPDVVPPSKLQATIVEPTAFEHAVAEYRAGRPWERVYPVPDEMKEPAKRFLTYLMTEVESEYTARIDGGKKGYYETKSAANESRVREVTRLYGLWKRFTDHCGPFVQIGPMTYRTSYAGEYVEATLRGRKRQGNFRLSFADDGVIVGCWFAPNLFDQPDPSESKASLHYSTKSGVVKFEEKTYSLAIDARVIDKERPTAIRDCHIDIWQLTPACFAQNIRVRRHLQDRTGNIWSRVQTNSPSLSRGQRDAVNHLRVSNLAPGIYRVSARVSGRPGGLVSDDILLDGSQETVAVNLSIEWGDLEVVLQDGTSNENIEVEGLQLFLGGWRWRTWTFFHQNTIPWQLQAGNVDKLLGEHGRYKLHRVPAGRYVLGFSRPVDCKPFGKDNPPLEIVVDVWPGVQNRYSLSTKSIRDYVNWNFDLYFSPDPDAVGKLLMESKWSAFNDPVASDATAALLGFCDRRESRELLIDRLQDFQTNSIAALALARHAHFRPNRVLQPMTRQLALMNVARDGNPLPAVALLRRLQKVSRTSEHVAQLDASDTIKQLALDLGSSVPALSVYAAHELAAQGELAMPAIPFLIEALADDRPEGDDEEDLIGYQTVSQAAREALESLRESDPSGRIEAALKKEVARP